MEVWNNLDFGKAFHELLPKLFEGAFQIVVEVTIIGFLLALVIGFLLALARVSKCRVLNVIVKVFQEIIRGTPLLVQLVYVYYVVPLLIKLVAGLLGAENFECNLSAVTAGIIGMAINYGTYISEVIRSAILAIDAGQTEAALALGLSRKQAMFRIVIPQAFKNSVPVFGNYLVMLVKDTSLMAYITVQEFLLTAKAYISQTFLTIESYTIVAVVYLVICLPLSWLIGKLEKICNKSKR